MDARNTADFYDQLAEIAGDHVKKERSVYVERRSNSDGRVHTLKSLEVPTRRCHCWLAAPSDFFTRSSMSRPHAPSHAADVRVHRADLLVEDPIDDHVSELRRTRVAYSGEDRCRRRFDGLRVFDVVCPRRRADQAEREQQCCCGCRRWCESPSP